jgi:hypothetical protein
MVHRAEPQRLCFVRIDAPLLHVPDNADNLLRVLPVLVNALAYWICIAEVFAGQDFVNHDNGLRSFVVLLGEEGPA